MGENRTGGLKAFDIRDVVVCGRSWLSNKFGVAWFVMAGARTVGDVCERRTSVTGLSTA